MQVTLSNPDRTINNILELISSLVETVLMENGQGSVFKTQDDCFWNEVFVLFYFVVVVCFICLLFRIPLKFRCYELSTLMETTLMKLIGSYQGKTWKHKEDCWRKRGLVGVGEEPDKAREEEHVQSAIYTCKIPSKKNNKIVKVRKFENAIYMVDPQ